MSVDEDYEPLDVRGGCFAAKPASPKRRPVLLRESAASILPHPRRTSEA